MLMESKIGIHRWDFEQIASSTVSYEVSTLQIVDTSNSATMLAADIFMDSPNGSDFYPFIYSIQVMG